MIKEISENMLHFGKNMLPNEHKILYELVKKSVITDSKVILFDKKTLRNLLKMNHPTVNNSLKKLEEKGIITIEKNRIKFTSIRNKIEICDEKIPPFFQKISSEINQVLLKSSY